MQGRATLGELLRAFSLLTRGFELVTRALLFHVIKVRETVLYKLYPIH